MAMLTFRFNAHLECYKEVMEELMNENSEHQVEFELDFTIGEACFCSKRCKEVRLLESQYESPSKKKRNITKEKE
jgi:hypothetical protein